MFQGLLLQRSNKRGPDHSDYIWRLVTLTRAGGVGVDDESWVGGSSREKGGEELEKVRKIKEFSSFAVMGRIR